MAQKIQLRRDTAANWTATNPILSQGEFGVELVTNLTKIGDGVTVWNSLVYATSALSTFIGTTAHILSRASAPETLAGLTFTTPNIGAAVGTSLALGLNASILGSLKLFGNTSGDVTLQPNAIAGTGIVLTLPAVTGTLVTGGGTAVGTNTGDNAANSSTMYIGITVHALNRPSGAEGLSGITSLTPGSNFTLVQNSVDVITSIETGAIVNTFSLKEGKVGIGTLTPSDKLNVVVTSNGNILRCDGPTSGFIIQTNASTVDFVGYGGMTPAYHDFNICTSATPALTILTTGNVGIGTTTPTSKLSVVGLPTSTAGLSTGDIWVDTTGGLNILKIV